MIKNKPIKSVSNNNSTNKIYKPYLLNIKDFVIHIKTNLSKYFKNIFFIILTFVTVTLITLAMFILVSALGCRNKKVNSSISNTILSQVLADNILRFHVIGASDSDYDQNLKLKVRDEVIHYMSCYEDQLSTKADVVAFITEHINIIKGIADKILAQNGCYKTTEVSLENKYFPIREYGSVLIPSGYYDSLCIYIAEAEGRNWWCIMFPKLCFSDPLSPFPSDESIQLLKTVLSEEEYKELCKEDKKIEVEYRFKLFDIIKNLFE